jgi:hypothetical protein
MARLEEFSIESGVDLSCLVRFGERTSWNVECPSSMLSVLKLSKL